MRGALPIKGDISQQRHQTTGSLLASLLSHCVRYTWNFQKQPCLGLHSSTSHLEVKGSPENQRQRRNKCPSESVLIMAYKYFSGPTDITPWFLFLCCLGDLGVTLVQRGYHNSRDHSQLQILLGLGLATYRPGLGTIHTLPPLSHCLSAWCPPYQPPAFLFSLYFSLPLSHLPISRPPLASSQLLISRLLENQAVLRCLVLLAVHRSLVKTSDSRCLQRPPSTMSTNCPGQVISWTHWEPWNLPG